MTASLGIRAPKPHSPQTLRPDDRGTCSDIERLALRQLIAELPNAAEFARALPPTLIEALCSAWRTREGIRLSDQTHIAHLRRLGLVEFGGPYLSNFGTAVRRALMEG